MGGDTLSLIPADTHSLTADGSGRLVITTSYDANSAASRAQASISSPSLAANSIVLSYWRKVTTQCFTITRKFCLSAQSLHFEASDCTKYAVPSRCEIGERLGVTDRFCFQADISNLELESCSQTMNY